MKLGEIDLVATNLKIGLPLFVLGIGVVEGSIYFQSTPLAFIGLSLIFWGILFFTVLKTRYVKPQIVSGMISSSFTSLEDIIKFLNIKGRAIYIPTRLNPYLSSLSGIDQELIYLPIVDLADEDAIAESFQKNPVGVRITPPGQQLANLMEEVAGFEIQTLDQNSLKNFLKTTIVEKLELADFVDVKLEKNVITVLIRGVAFSNPCKNNVRKESICEQIGCPLCSSVACSLTRISKRPVRLQNCNVISENRIQINFSLI
jgi:hypothetical protein